MRIARRAALWNSFFLFLFVCFPSFAQQQSQKTQDGETSCVKFVQSFYDWYLPKVKKAGSEVALKYRSQIFSRELVRALREDYAASARNSEEVVGLDFDPFLNTQDPEDHYVTGSVTRNQDHCLVDVYGVSAGKKEKDAAVEPELVFRNGRWIFVNFHYPGLPEKENDLLSVLSKLRRDREPPAKNSQ